MPGAIAAPEVGTDENSRETGEALNAEGVESARGDSCVRPRRERRCPQWMQEVEADAWQARPKKRSSVRALARAKPKAKPKLKVGDQVEYLWDGQWELGTVRKISKSLCTICFDDGETWRCALTADNWRWIE